MYNANVDGQNESFIRSNSINFLRIFLLIFLLSFINQLFAQDITSESLKSFHQNSIKINENAMLILGGWAAGNILIGTYGNFKYSGVTKYFHQFNAMWNVVNLGIASMGYFNAINSDASSMTSLEIIKDYNSLQSFLLLNAGLDAAYIMTGLYLKERSKNSSSWERLRGYGNSLLLQGGFLLAFDITFYLIQQNNANLKLYPHLESLLANGIGIGISLNF